VALRTVSIRDKHYMAVAIEVSASTSSYRERKEKEIWLRPDVYETLIENSPIVCVDLIILDEQKCLLIRRAIPPFVSYWHLPGGLLRKGERLRACVKRKALEETGLTVRIETMLGVYDDPSANPLRHDVVITFICRPIGGKLQGSWQGHELSFFPLDKLPRKIGFSVRDEIKDAKRLMSGYGWTCGNAHTATTIARPFSPQKV
jgi:8-oxo-dGTP diphosphatase